MKSLISTILFATSSVFNLAIAEGWGIDLAYGVGMSDQPIFTYIYPDGSTNKLVPGDGFSFLLSKDVFQLGPAALNLRAGLNWEAQTGDSLSGEAMNHRFSYLPVYLTGKLDLSRQLSIAGGLSYLFLPKYVGQVGSDKVIAELASSFGYNAELRYTAIQNVDNPKRVIPGIFVRYSTNSASLTTVSSNQGDTIEVPDGYSIDISALSFGITFEF
ncbi:MAG: hypothetical protein P8X74_03240 [Reinekea sp.]